MIRVFAYIRDYFESRALKASDYRITITPLTQDAEARLKTQWCTELDGLQMAAKPAVAFYDGYLSGMPFRIESTTE